MNLAASLAAAAAAAAFAAPASAQFAKPEDAIKYRQSAMVVMAHHLGRIGAMVNGRVPYDQQSAVANAEVFATLVKLPWVGFGPGTDKGRETRAKPEIWAEQAKFKEHQDKLQAEAPKLVAAARTNSPETLKVAFGPVAQVCKGCHDTYRKD